MIKSESIKELATALAIAQGQIRGAAKDTENPFFKSKYADLASVWDACRDALSANGLSVIQAARAIESGVEVETMLMHASGEFVAETLAIPVTKADAQGFGSALTYCRRYGLSAMVGIAPEDDDGNAAAKAKPDNGKFAPLKAPIPAHSGVMETLDLERQEAVQYHANRIADAFIAGDERLAFDCYGAAKLELSTDEQVALRGVMQSAHKTTLRKMAEAEKERSLRAMAAGEHPRQ